METVETGARSRTRAAILDAAIEVFGADGKASLAEVAERANIGRSTLHRYFPERSDLLRAVTYESYERIERAAERAEPTSGAMSDALRRTVDALLDLGPIMMFLSSDPAVLADEELAALDEEPYESVLDRLFTRPEAGLRPGITPDWATNAFWALLYAGWEAVKAGEMRRSEIVDAIIATLSGGLLAEQ